ncbi:MAG: hypothetical protein ACTIJR_09990 [Brevibacterium linens]
MADLELDLTAPNYETALITLGVTGALHYGPYGTALPEKMADPAAPMVDLGWLSDSGIAESLNQERSDWKPWQATSPQRGQITSEEATFQATLWSVGGLANALYYGVAEEDMTYDEASGVTSFETGSKLPEDFRFCLTVTVLDGKKARRYLMPAASVTERGDITHTNTDLVGYELTFKANFDATSGFAIRREFKEGWKPGTSGTILEGGGVKDLGDWSTPADGGAEGE